MSPAVRHSSQIPRMLEKIRVTYSHAEVTLLGNGLSGQ